MKRLAIWIAALLMPIMGFAQAQINTKKVKISDFTQKVTKVVLTGNMFYDSTMEDEIVARWKVSPYEFCTVDEFEELKGNEEYYFLITTKGQFKKETEPGLQFLTLVKGGKKAEEGIANMLEIISIPVCAAEDPSGRELAFIPAFLDIIQNFTLEAMEKDISAYSGLSNYSTNLYETKGKKVIFAEEDLSSEITDDVKESSFDEDMLITEADDADDIMLKGEESMAVSYVAAPSDPVPGSYCYKMLIDNHTHSVYYFKKHRITKSTGAGFLVEDVRRISTYRAK